jgi:hypothetical protein
MQDHSSGDRTIVEKKMLKKKIKNSILLTVEKVLAL